MKLTAKLLFVLFCFTLITPAQSNVENVIEQLEKLSNTNYDNWKYSTDFTYTVEELSSPGFDDSAWEDLTIRKHLDPDSCWMRKVITLPEYLVAQETAGRLNIYVTVDDYGRLYVNGEDRGEVQWSGEYTLTENAVPGQEIVLLIKAFDTGGPMRLLQAEVEFADENSVMRKVKDLILSLQTGKKLLS